MQASGSVFRRPLRQRSASFEELSAAPWAGSGGSAKSATGAPKAAAPPKSVVKQHKLLFVHFQINRVHCRVTYTVWYVPYFTKGDASIKPHAIPERHAEHGGRGGPAGFFQDLCSLP